MTKWYSLVRKQCWRFWIINKYSQVVLPTTVWIFLHYVELFPIYFHSKSVPGLFLFSTQSPEYFTIWINWVLSQLVLTVRFLNFWWANLLDLAINYDLTFCDRPPAVSPSISKPPARPKTPPRIHPGTTKADVGKYLSVDNSCTVVEE